MVSNVGFRAPGTRAITPVTILVNIVMTVLAIMTFIFVEITIVKPFEYLKRKCSTCKFTGGT